MYVYIYINLANQKAVRGHDGHMLGLSVKKAVLLHILWEACLASHLLVLLWETVMAQVIGSLPPVWEPLIGWRL